uniref:Methyltransferase type 11 domain-containing protein n=1 Tax=Thermosporothrix sp. COM3 TaxID=2490863 RepID=A0A455SSU3_9CHLR|nr:hypothetical protein KTC_54370 [Thermosporothrix sp. COM3]
MCSRRTTPETIDAYPFQIHDLDVFDDEMLHHLLSSPAFDVPGLAWSMQDGAAPAFVERVRAQLPAERLPMFEQALHQPISTVCRERARRRLLKALFWDLTYWKTPELYEELTEGERLHPELLRQLQSEIQDRVVLDAGAGTGRATFACLRHGARQVYAVEPSPGLRHLLECKCQQDPLGERVRCLAGRFDALPLADKSVDIALSCSAFTADDEQGGEPGLAELRRVTRDGGKILILAPRMVDLPWFQGRGFQHVSFPADGSVIQFRSFEAAVRCARHFYAHNRAMLDYILSRRCSAVPCSIVGVKPLNDYCWLQVTGKDG